MSPNIPSQRPCHRFGIHYARLTISTSHNDEIAFHDSSQLTGLVCFLQGCDESTILFHGPHRDPYVFRELIYAHRPHDHSLPEQLLKHLIAAANAKQDEVRLARDVG